MAAGIIAITAAHTASPCATAHTPPRHPAFSTAKKRGAAQHAPRPHRETLPSVARVDVHVLGFADEQRADDGRDARDDDGVPEAVVHVARLRHDGERHGGQQAAEPAVADVVRQAHRGVADARREHLHQHRRDGAIHHGHQQHQVGQDDDHHHLVHLGGVGLGGIAVGLQRFGHGLLEGGVLGLGFLGRQAAGGVARDRGLADLDHRGRAGRRGLVVVAHRAGGQHLLGDVAGAGELGRAGRVELERALGRVGHDHHLVLRLRGGQVGVGGFGQRLEDGEIRQHGQNAAQHDDGLAADPVGERSEDDEERRADQQGGSDHQVGRDGVHLELLREEEERIELARVPDHRLAGGEADQRQDHDLQVLPLAERFAQWRLGGLALGLHALEGGRLRQREPDPQRHAQQQDGNEERDAPAPVGEGLLAHGGAGSQDHQQRQEQAHRGGGLDPRGIGAALALRRMLGHVGRRAAVLAAQGQALQHAQHDQDDRGGHADAGIGRQDTHDEGGQAHDQDGDQEGVLAPDHVAQPPEHQRTEGPHDEAGSEGQQREDERGARVQPAEELLGDDGGERTVQVEVIPFENGAQRRGQDDFSFFRRHRPVSDIGSHGACLHEVIGATAPRAPSRTPRATWVALSSRHLTEV